VPQYGLNLFIVYARLVQARPKATAKGVPSKPGTVDVLMIVSGPGRLARGEYLS
jgi:hypothetical protein